MDQNQDLIDALSSTPESLYQDYMSAGVTVELGGLYPSHDSNVPVGLFDIWRGPLIDFGILCNVGPSTRVSHLPKAWHLTQSALARAFGFSFGFSLEKGMHSLPSKKFLTNSLRNTDKTVLKELLVVLYHYQIERLIQEMKEAGTNIERQQDNLGRMAEPLQRYSIVVAQQSRLFY